MYTNLTNTFVRSKFYVNDVFNTAINYYYLFLVHYSEVGVLRFSDDANMTSAG